MIIAVNGIGSGMFAAPNSSSIMGSVPARHRGAASGMRSTFQNSGTALSIGVFFSLMIAGLAASLPTHADQRAASSTACRPRSPSRSARCRRCRRCSPPCWASTRCSTCWPGRRAAPRSRPRASRSLTGREFFPQLISGPFHQGLVVVFSAAAALSVVAALASLLRGGKFVPREPAAAEPSAAAAEGTKAAS